MSSEQEGLQPLAEFDVVPSRQFFDLIPDAVVIVDRDGRIRHTNTTFQAMFGYGPDDLRGAPLEILVPERLRERHRHNRDNYVRAPNMRRMGTDLDFFARRKDGSEFPADIMLSPLPSSEGLVMAVVRDVTMSSNLRDELRRLAFFDPLTGLPNRTAFYRDLSNRLSPASDGAVPATAIALFDLDGFKDVNDLLGHAAGDQLLKSVTERWMNLKADPTRTYRLGGDEFVVIMPEGHDARQVVSTTEVMLDAFSAPFEVYGEAISIGASAGLAVGPRDGADAGHLLGSADLALYAAKAAGRGSHMFFEPPMRSLAEARKNMNARLQSAFEQGEFRLYYQPKILLADGSLTGAEVLLRWQQAERVVPPAAFIQALADSALAPKLGSWIFRTACERIAAWRAQGFFHGRLCVNLFPGQFRHHSFISQLQAALADTGIPPQAIELEFTEDIALNADTETLATLDRLRALGMRLALDDFGTGYASLSHLTRLPLDDIKIDRSFIQGIPADVKSAAIVRSLISLAHSLGLGVVAEGVETEEQMEFLRLQGCDEVQGFLFAKPMPEPEFEALLRSEGVARHRHE